MPVQPVQQTVPIRFAVQVIVQFMKAVIEVHPLFIHRATVVKEFFRSLPAD